MAQKFKKGARVLVSVSKHKTWMSHFKTGFVGIVEGSYEQVCLYQKSGGKSYSVYVLNEKQNQIVNKVAWYDEEDLTLVGDQDTKIIAQLIGQYLLK